MHQPASGLFALVPDGTLQSENTGIVDSVHTDLEVSITALSLEELRWATSEFQWQSKDQRVGPISHSPVPDSLDHNLDCLKKALKYT